MTGKRFTFVRLAMVHYLIAVLVLSIYGGQVCPVVEGLHPLVWALILFISLGAVFPVRSCLLSFFIYQHPAAQHVPRILFLEIFLFFVGAFAATLHNTLRYGSDLESALKIGTGFLICGFFAAMDVALAYERKQAVAGGGKGRNVTAGFMTVTQKLGLVSGISVFSIMLVLFFIISKDLEWLASLPPDAIFNAQFSILSEIAFVLFVLSCYAGNLFLSYSRNIRLFLNNETEVLADVAGGNLNTHVSVRFHDEFGQIAEYTNEMIAGLRMQNAAVEQLRDVIIHSMASLAETRDNETGAHILRTQHYVRVIAEYLSRKPEHGDALNQETIAQIYKSAPLHDIGKVGVPDAILLKPGRLTEEEFQIMRAHTRYGGDAILQAEERLGKEVDAAFLGYARKIAYFHHEKWDGSGYPEGLSGTDIPLCARIMALADVYDALISKRVYKPAFSHEKAREILIEGSGQHFDPEIVDAFLACEIKFQEIAERYKDSETKGLT